MKALACGLVSRAVGAQWYSVAMMWVRSVLLCSRNFVSFGVLTALCDVPWCESFCLLCLASYAQIEKGQSLQF